MGDAEPTVGGSSPLSVGVTARGRRSRSSLSSDGTALYWLESRPEEGGRTVLVRAHSDGRDDVSPVGTSIRSRVHEYGGGAYCLVPRPTGDPVVAYVDQDDQRVRLLEPGAPPRLLGAEPTEGERWNHGDLRATPDGAWVLGVRECHRSGPVARSVVAFAADPRAGTVESVLCTGRDFFSAPRPSPSGGRVAWIVWDHPDMSWDASELWAGELRDAGEDLSIVDAGRVAGGRDAASEGVGESVGQPLWCRDGSLVFASDRRGWWQPWRWAGGGPPVLLCDDEAEFHAPDWSLGQSTMVELPDGAVACRRRRDGFDSVGVVFDGVFRPVDQPCVSVSGLCPHGEGFAWLGATPYSGAGPWWVSEPSGHPEPFCGAEPALLAPDLVAVGEPFTADDDGPAVHGLFWAPVPEPEHRPPLIVICHGGPTGSADAGFDPVVQLFTTRGYAVAAVDYAGSSGYGRAYRERLTGLWGLADVEDCLAAAKHLAAIGRVRHDPMAVRGASAGGFTALLTLAAGDAFACAVSWYGVTDLLALAAATHDFEAHYTDRLVGPLPQTADEYRRRSPVQRVDEMVGAVLVLQGLDDPVVPPEQASAMVAALRARGVRCDELTFPGESHGFRRAETLVACLEAELAFYRGVLHPG